MVLQNDVQVFGWLNFLFALSATTLSMSILRSINYFNALRIKPRPSDIVSIMVALPIAGVLVDIAIRVIFEVSIARIIPIAVAGVVAGMIVFALHSVIGWLLLGGNTTLKVVFYTLPHERDLLVHDLSLLGLTKHIEILPPSALRDHVYSNHEHDIDLIIISRSATAKAELDATIIRAHLAGIPVADFVELSNDLVGRVRLDYVEPWSFATSGTPQTLLLRLFWVGKVVAEPLIALFLLLALLPIYFLIFLSIRILDPGPAIYRQVRIGYLGRPFTLVKFRTMRLDAEKDGPQWSGKTDDRVTPLGKFLRRSRLDELPQLWNVVKGEMGFFGPRPERPEIYRALQEKIPLFSMRTLVRPGITGWAQAFAGYAASVEESRRKLEFDLYYIQHISPRLDFMIIVHTVLVVLFGDKTKTEVEINSLRVV